MQRQPPYDQRYPPGQYPQYNQYNQYQSYGQQPAAQGAWGYTGQPAAGYTGQPASGQAYQGAPYSHYAQPAAGGAHHPAGASASPQSPYYASPYASPRANTPQNGAGASPAPDNGDAILARLKVDFPEIHEKTLATAVRTKRTYHDALAWLRLMQRQNLMPTAQPPMEQAMPQRRTIREKFSANQQHQQQFRQFAYQQTPMAQQPQLQRQSFGAKRGGFDEDESASDESDSDTYDPEALAAFDARLLEFLNTASPDAIADVAAQPMELVDALVKKRPFASLSLAAKVDVPSVTPAPEPGAKRRRGAAKKPAGSKIIDAARTTLRGYEAVDALIKECARMGRVVQKGVSAWGLNDETLETTGQGFFKEQPQMLAEGVQLKNYQQVGINWLSLLYRQRLSCILADEMGLGKTLQVIAFLAHLKEIGEPGPHLVVCPASTLENWLRECARFCPGLHVEPYYGGQPERAEIREQIISQGAKFDVLVTTYNLATGGKQDMGFLKSLGFNVCVYDEGHLLKNSQSERYNKLMRLRARFRVLLTGTPLQNNLRELVSLLSFILPSLFEQNKEDLLEVFRFKAKATANGSEESRDELLSEQRIRKAKTMMSPFVMRRRKEQVLAHLPPKNHEVLECEMTPNQAVLYEREVKQNKKGLKTAKHDVDEHPATKKGQREAGKRLDNVLMQLRKAALHPLLFREHYPDARLRKMAKAIMNEEQYKKANETYIFEDMQVMNDFELDRLCRQFPVTLGEYILDDEQFTDSGKVKLLVDMLKGMNARGDRVLLFSQFTQVLDILQRVLDILGLKFLRLDGQTAVEVRQDLIDQFHENTEIDVFLLSTKAGGFGINLAVANVVIIFDLSFNPHDDKQAEDRAHRVGQTRPVRVVRMITKDSIEENILQLANTKLALDKQVSEDQNEDEDEIDAEKEAYVAGMLLDGNRNGDKEDSSSDDEPDAAADTEANAEVNDGDTTLKAETVEGAKHSGTNGAANGISNAGRRANGNADVKVDADGDADASDGDVDGEADADAAVADDGSEDEDSDDFMSSDEEIARPAKRRATRNAPRTTRSTRASFEPVERRPRGRPRRESRD